MVNKTGELLEPWGYNLAAAVLIAVQIFGFLLNLLVIILMCRDAKIWNPINIIIFNLVCCDFAVSILGNPFALASALSHRWIFGEIGCQLYGFFMALLGIASITTISAMSFERYFMVNFPFSSHQLTNRGAIVSIILIWLYASAVTCPPLFGWGAYVSEAADISCSVNWEEQIARTYITYLFILGLVVPLIVIIFCYINIIITLRRSSSRLNRTSAAERKVIIMVFVMFTGFMFGWSPYATFALIKQYGNKDLISPAMGVIPSLFAKTTICYNPIIYVGLNTQFRQAFDRFLGGEPTVPAKIMTVSTTANVLDSDAKRTIKDKLQTVNTHNIDLQSHVKDAASIKDNETIELKVLNDGKMKGINKGKSVKIQIM